MGLKNSTNPTIGNSTRDINVKTARRHNEIVQRGGVANRENYTPGPSDYHVGHVLTQAPRYVRPIKSRVQEFRDKGNLTARVNIDKRGK